MKTAVKRTSDEKKQELEKRILDVLTEVFKDAVPVFLADLSSQEEFVFGITRDQLYFRTEAAKYGSTAVFNSVISELAKAGLVQFGPARWVNGEATNNGVCLSGALFEKAVSDVLTPLGLSVPQSTYPLDKRVAQTLYGAKTRGKFERLKKEMSG
jgi:hypothetical protein